MEFLKISLAKKIFTIYMLLCDEFGDPVSTEVFAGNTQDTKRFVSQVRKAAERFGCERVTFVGDRGMIKSTQIGELPEGAHYITALTKAQIQSLVKKGIIQMGLFDEEVCEVLDGDVRYILRRNPVRADEITETRLSKRRYVEKYISKNNLYLSEHKRAKVSVAIADVRKKIEHLKIDGWLKVKTTGRVLSLEVDEESLKEESLLDGCYVIKTDLFEGKADKQIVHDRYKDLALVEEAFRDIKSVSLEVRPVFVRTKKSIYGHVEVVMLAYMIIRKLREVWSEFDLTVEEGIKRLSTLCTMEMRVKGQGSCLRIPRPRKESQELLKALDIRMPNVLPHRKVNVVTRKKLTKRRKMFKNRVLRLA